MKKKNFVLDTNVILTDPNCIFNFENNNVYIPMIVIEEIDKFKKSMNNLGYGARQFSRIIDELREQSPLIEGVTINNDGMFKIIQVPNEKMSEYSLDLNINDNVIVASAKYIQETEKEETILVSKDINVRLKGDILGIKSENYTTDNVDVNEIPLGYRTIIVPAEVISNIHKQGYSSYDFDSVDDLYPNEYFLLRNNENHQNQAIVRYRDDDTESLFVKITEHKGKRNSLLGISPRSIEQQILVDMLLEPEIKLVSVLGKAGSGKTLISIVAAMYEVYENFNYNKISIAKPIISMGNHYDIGFLPGTKEQKLLDWNMPFMDNIDFILSGNPGGIGKDNHKTLSEVLDSDQLEMLGLSYLRGRSLHNQFIICDEMQNSSVLDIKTILTRVSHGSKIVLLGDISQIDTPFQTSNNNGLIYSLNKLKHSNLTSNITLTKGERSELSALSADNL